MIRPISVYGDRVDKRIVYCPMVIENIWQQPEGYYFREGTGSWFKDKISLLCWRLLHKIGALRQFGYYEKLIRYNEPEQEKLTDLVHDSIIHILNRDLDPDDFAIVVGAKEFSEIVGEAADFPSYITMPARTYYKGGRGYRAEFENIPIHVVQSISGAAVIPKVLIEKEV